MMSSLVGKKDHVHERTPSRSTRSRAASAEPIRSKDKLPRALGNRALGQLLAGPAKAHTGLPGKLKTGIENLSGLAMDDVKVHYDSAKPAQLRALAHTRGNEIHLGPGQQKHLAHEAWHVVQQKQGRVKSQGVQAKGASINEDPTLEREADRMGTAALQGHSSARVHGRAQLRPSPSLQSQVVQLKKVPDKLGPTDLGQFETTKFAAADGRGVDIILKFHPEEGKVDAKKIALSQSVINKLPSGADYAIDPNSATRMVGSGKPGAGYYTDRLSTFNNPIYGARNLGPTEELKDTPESGNTTADKTEVGKNTKYELGKCYKDKPTDAKAIKQSAGLFDTVRSSKRKGEDKMFETAAFAIEGVDKDKYYGSVKWGYKMEGTVAAPTVTPKDIELASTGGVPSANFLEPAKLWNKAKTRGTLEVTADPEATVQKDPGPGTEKLAKGTKLKQLQNIVMMGDGPAVNAEVLKADGTGSGKFVYIKNSDVKDMGDGSANKALPIPAGAAGAAVGKAVGAAAAAAAAKAAKAAAEAAAKAGKK